MEISEGGEELPSTVSPLHMRMQEVLARRKWSKRQWSIAARSSELSHVAKIMKNLERTGEAYSGDLRTWAKLAAAASVSLDWLVFGRGSPWDAIPNDPYPWRQRVAEVARVLGFSGEAIMHINSMGGFADDPGVYFWLTELMRIDPLLGRQRPGRPRKPTGDGKS